MECSYSTGKDLEMIQARLRSLVTEEEARRWMHTPNVLLGGLSPMDAITSGNIDRVSELLTSVEEGIHV